MARHFISFACVFTLLSVVSVVVSAQNIATVNGKPIPKSRADLVVKELMQRGEPDSPALQKRARDILIEREILLQEAERRGISKNQDVKLQMEVLRQNVLIEALQRDIVKTPPSEAKLRAEYEYLKKQIGDTEYHASHILVEQEDQAKALIEKLKKKEKFEDLAKQNSKDPGSAEKGGDLGWNSAASFVTTFSDAMKKLEKGKFTETPVKSEYGWHIIKLEDIRPAQPPEFEEIKPRLIGALQQQELEKFRQALHAKAKIK